MEEHDLRRVMRILFLIMSLTLGMIFDSIVVSVSLVAADSIVRAFSSFGIPVYYFYDKSWRIPQIISMIHDFTAAIYLAAITSLVVILIWIIARRIAKPRVNVLDI
jgi:hypothetical protein